MRTLLCCFISVLFFCSCQKKEGCTDITAVNYDASAQIDNGTCKHCDPFNSSFFIYGLTSEDTTVYELEVALPGDQPLNLGCKLFIDMTNFSLPLADTKIEWGPADIFDCSRCLNVTITPLETTKITLKIENIDGYHFLGSFTILVF